MVDREQEQARLLADTLGADGRPGRDLGWIVALTIACTGLSISTGAVTRLLNWLDELPGGNLDGLLALVLLLPVGATIYAVRRYRDAGVVRDKLYELSSHDSLTGLPNRRFLGDGFDAMLRSSRKVNGHIGVFFIDLDGFKKVNDTWGHEVGDQLMTAVADRLRGVVAPSGQVVRYAGDEFIALIPDVTNVLATERVATRLLAAIESPFEFGDDRLRISASIGIAITEERCSRADEVLRDADAAMYHAKRQGPGQFAVFDRTLGDQLTPSTAERRLRQALDNGELRLYYQPIVSLWTKRLVGVDAILRWEDPQAGLVDGAEFLSILEDTGLIVPIGNWVIEEVCAQSRRWQDEFPDRPALNIKINVSARQLAQANFVQHLRECLERSGAEPDRISLEITEGALMYDVQSAWSTLREAKLLGVSLALDDFGTGYSSLSYLRQFSLDLLKIDRSFVDGLDHSREDATIVEHVIGMAKALGIVTLAEGVTTPEQAEKLRALNCDLAQGDHFSDPRPPSVISELVEAGTSEEWHPPAPEDESPDRRAPVVVAHAHAGAHEQGSAGADVGLNPDAGSGVAAGLAARAAARASAATRSDS
jgi:diguanylate cyclase (GGDEF)-like protein